MTRSATTGLTPGVPAMGERILDASLDLFARTGFDGTTVRAIADACGLTDAALYYYFPNKRAILEALLARPRESIAERPRPSRPVTEEWIHLLVDATLDEIAAEGPLFRIILDQALDGDRTALALRAKTASAWRRALLATFSVDDPSLAEDRTDAFMMLIHGAVLSVYIDHDVAFRELSAREDVRAHIKQVVVDVLGPVADGSAQA